MTWVKMPPAIEIEGKLQVPDGQVVILPTNITDFLKFLQEDSRVTPGVYEMALRSSMWWLKIQAETLNGGTVERGYVSSLSCVPKLTKKVRDQKHKTKRTDMVDLQSDQDETLSRAKWITMFQFLMGFTTAVGFFYTPFMFASWSCLFRHFSETGPCRVFGSASFIRVRP